MPSYFFGGLVMKKTLSIILYAFGPGYKRSNQPDLMMQRKQILHITETKTDLKLI